MAPADSFTRMSTTIDMISPGVAQQRLGAGAVLVDVRTLAEFRAGHAVGVRHLELATLERDPEALARNWPEVAAGAPLIFVCQSGIRATKAAQLALRIGKNPVAVMEGGTERWASLNLPMERVSGAISLERQVRIAAGAMAALGSLLALTTGQMGWVVVPLFIGSGLVFAGFSNWCGMAMVLAKMPWNR